MLGSSQSIAGPNIALNTIMAEELSRFADSLEKAEDFDATLQTIVSRALQEHRRIIFEGNGYSDAWKEEAARRCLSNLPSTAEALPTYVSQKNIDLVVRHRIFTENEFRARYAIHLESYNKIVNIEARTMVDMATQQILPAALRYTRSLCETVKVKGELGMPCKGESALIRRLSDHTEKLWDAVEVLKKELDALPQEVQAKADGCRQKVIPSMKAVRTQADALEALTDKGCWPYPTYSDLLFY